MLAFVRQRRTGPEQHTFAGFARQDQLLAPFVPTRLQPPAQLVEKFRKARIACGELCQVRRRGCGAEVTARIVAADWLALCRCSARSVTMTPVTGATG